MDNVQEVREILSSLKQGFQCVICLDLLTDPVSTKCNHQFCSGCIRELFLKTGKKSKEARCPLCKAVVTKRSVNAKPALAKIVSALREVFVGADDDFDLIGEMPILSQRQKVTPLKVTPLKRDPSSKRNASKIFAEEENIPILDNVADDIFKFADTSKETSRVRSPSKSSNLRLTEPLAERPSNIRTSERAEAAEVGNGQDQALAKENQRESHSKKPSRLVRTRSKRKKISKHATDLESVCPSTLIGVRDSDPSERDRENKLDNPMAVDLTSCFSNDLVSEGSGLASRSTMEDSQPPPGNEKVVPEGVSVAIALGVSMTPNAVRFDDVLSSRQEERDHDEHKECVGSKNREVNPQARCSLTSPLLKDQDKEPAYLASMSVKRTGKRSVQLKRKVEAIMSEEKPDGENKNCLPSENISTKTKRSSVKNSNPRSAREAPDASSSFLHPDTSAESNASVDASETDGFVYKQFGKPHSSDEAYPVEKAGSKVAASENAIDPTSVVVVEAVEAPSTHLQSDLVCSRDSDKSKATASNLPDNLKVSAELFSENVQAGQLSSNDYLVAACNVVSENDLRSTSGVALTSASIGDAKVSYAEFVPVTEETMDVHLDSSGQQTTEGGKDLTRLPNSNLTFEGVRRSDCFLREKDDHADGVAVRMEDQSEFRARRLQSYSEFNVLSILSKFESPNKDRTMFGNISFAKVSLSSTSGSSNSLNTRPNRELGLLFKRALSKESCSRADSPCAMKSQPRLPTGVGLGVNDFDLTLPTRAAADVDQVPDEDVNCSADSVPSSDDDQVRPDHHLPSAMSQCSKKKPAEDINSCADKREKQLDIRSSRLYSASESEENEGIMLPFSVREISRNVHLTCSPQEIVSKQAGNPDEQSIALSDDLLPPTPMLAGSECAPAKKLAAGYGTEIDPADLLSSTPVKLAASEVNRRPLESVNAKPSEEGYGSWRNGEDFWNSDQLLVAAMMEGERKRSLAQARAESAMTCSEKVLRQSRDSAAVESEEVLNEKEKRHMRSARNNNEVGDIDKGKSCQGDAHEIADSPDEHLLGSANLFSDEVDYALVCTNSKITYKPDADHLDSSLIGEDLSESMIGDDFHGNGQTVDSVLEQHGRDHDRGTRSSASNVPTSEVVHDLSNGRPVPRMSLREKEAVRNPSEFAAASIHIDAHSRQKCTGALESASLDCGIVTDGGSLVQGLSFEGEGYSQVQGSKRSTGNAHNVLLIDNIAARNAQSNFTCSSDVEDGPIRKGFKHARHQIVSDESDEDIELVHTGASDQVTPVLGGKFDDIDDASTPECRSTPGNRKTVCNEKPVQLPGCCSNTGPVWTGEVDSEACLRKLELFTSKFQKSFMKRKRRSSKRSELFDLLERFFEVAAKEIDDDSDGDVDQNITAKRSRTRKTLPTKKDALTVTVSSGEKATGTVGARCVGPMKNLPRSRDSKQSSFADANKSERSKDLTGRSPDVSGVQPVCDVSPPPPSVLTLSDIRDESCPSRAKAKLETLKRKLTSLLDEEPRGRCGDVGSAKELLCEASEDAQVDAVGTSTARNGSSNSRADSRHEQPLARVSFEMPDRVGHVTDLQFKPFTPSSTPTEWSKVTHRPCQVTPAGVAFEPVSFSTALRQEPYEREHCGSLTSSSNLPTGNAVQPKSSERLSKDPQMSRSCSKESNLPKASRAAVSLDNTQDVCRDKLPRTKRATVPADWKTNLSSRILAKTNGSELYSDRKDPGLSNRSSGNPPNVCANGHLDFAPNVLDSNDSSRVDRAERSAKRTSSLSSSNLPKAKRADLPTKDTLGVDLSDVPRATRADLSAKCTPVLDPSDPPRANRANVCYDLTPDLGSSKLPKANESKVPKRSPDIGPGDPPRSNQAFLSTDRTPDLGSNNLPRASKIELSKQTPDIGPRDPPSGNQAYVCADRTPDLGSNNLPRANKAELPKRTPDIGPNDLPRGDRAYECTDRTSDFGFSNLPKANGADVRNDFTPDLGSDNLKPKSKVPTKRTPDLGPNEPPRVNREDVCTDRADRMPNSGSRNLPKANRAEVSTGRTPDSVPKKREHNTLMGAHMALAPIPPLIGTVVNCSAVTPGDNDNHCVKPDVSKTLHQSSNLPTACVDSRDGVLGILGVMKNPVIVTSRLPGKYVQYCQAVAGKLGGGFVSTLSADATHLVTQTDAHGHVSKSAYTFKYLMALAKGLWLLSFEWIVKSLKAGKFLDEEEFEAKGDPIANQENIPKLARLSRLRNEPGLFDGYRLCLLGGFSQCQISKDQLSSVLVAGGAEIEETLRYVLCTSSQFQEQILVIADDLKQLSEEEQGLVRQYKLRVVHPDWVVESIINFRIEEVGAYTFKKTDVCE